MGNEAHSNEKSHVLAALEPRSAINKTPTLFDGCPHLREVDCYLLQGRLGFGGKDRIGREIGAGVSGVVRWG